MKRRCHSRVKRPVGAGKSVDDVGTGGCQLVVYLAYGGHDAASADGSAGLGKEAQHVADGIRVEGLLHGLVRLDIILVGVDNVHLYRSSC